jgi:hypothetical protein
VWGTAALTIFGGVLVYVLGKIVERAFIEPLNDYRQLVVEIAGALAMYAEYWGDTSAEERLSAYGQPDESWRAAIATATGKAARDLRAKAAQLAAYAVTIPWYRLWSLLRLVPDRHNALLASSELMGIANRLPARNHDDVKHNVRANRFIQQLLRLATK